MEIEVIEKSDTLTHLALKGRLDLQGVQAIETQFLAYTVARKKPALVDLSGVDYLVSMGIRMLLSSAKSMRANHTELVLLKPTPQVEETLRSVRLHDVVLITHDEDQARTRLGI